MACELLAVDAVHGLLGSTAWLDHDLLAGPPAHEGPCACWSGSLTNDRFAPDPRNWLPGARESFAAVLASTPMEVLVRPHTCQVLNDVPGTRSALAEQGRRPVALDLVALLTGPMVADPEPHVDRILHGLGTMAGAVLLADALVDEHDVVRPVPVGQGMLPGELVGHAVAQWLLGVLPADLPVCVLSPDEATAVSWLGL